MASARTRANSKVRFPDPENPHEHASTRPERNTKNHPGITRKRHQNEGLAGSCNAQTPPPYLRVRVFDSIPRGDEAICDLRFGRVPGTEPLRSFPVYSGGGCVGPSTLYSVTVVASWECLHTWTREKGNKPMNIECIDEQKYPAVTPPN